MISHERTPLSAGIALVMALGLAPTSASAGQLKHPSGFNFTLPDYTKWEIEVRGDAIAINDETDKLPELTVFFFPPRKGSSIEDVRGHLAEEINRPEVNSLGARFAKLRLTGTPTTETVGDVRVLAVDGVANGDDAVRVAILERAGKALIMLGVPKGGIEQRGAVNFDHIVHGVVPQVVKAGAASGTSDKKGEAREHNTLGMRLYRKKNYKGAEGQFRAAIDIDDDLVIAHYNLACVLSLMHDSEGTSDELDWLTKSKDPAAKEAFGRARVDPDLEWFRSGPVWKTFANEPKGN